MVAVVTTALVAVAVGLLSSATPRRADYVRVRSASRESLEVSSSASSTTDLASPSTAGTAIATDTRSAAATPPAESPIRADPSTGLTNTQVVTIRAAGIPPGGYLVGQCLTTGTVTLSTCAWNGSPQLAFPTDGILTATVGVYWWIGTEHVDCGSAPGRCSVGISSMYPTSDFAPMGVPISFDLARRPSITVSPADALVEGQSVTVQGRDVGVGTVELQECLFPWWASCISHEVPSSPDGTFSTSIKVRRSFEWGGHGPGSGACGVDGDCVIAVFLAPRNREAERMWLNRDQPAPLHFAPVPTTTTSSTTTSTVTTTTTAPAA